MAVERLIFDDNIEIPFSGGLRPAITYAINDLKNVGDRVGDYSKTITLPSSKALDKYFNHIFEINTVTLSFNPNKRTNIKYIADDEVILEGYLRLNDITINDNYKIDYKVSIFGKNTSLFSAIGEKELQDIDLSIYDHQMSVTNVQNSWDTSIIESGSPVAFSFGKGYIYPLINYGFDTNNRTYRLDHLFPAVYCKEYVDRIFEDAGKTYISNFFGSDTFKKLIIPFNGTSIAKTQTQIQNSTFQADNASVSKTSQSATTIIFPNEVADAGGVYDNTTGVFTANDSGFYNFVSIVDIEVDFTPSGNLVDAYVNIFPKVTIGLRKNGASTLIATSSFFLGDETVAIPPTTTYSTGVNVAYPSDAHSTNIQTIGNTVVKTDNKKTNPASNLPLVVNDIPLIAGDTIEVVWFVQKFVRVFPLITDDFRDLAGTTGFGGTTTFKVNSGKFLATVTNNSVLELGTVPMNNCIPKNIKQKDFLKSIMNMFRLEITPHPTLTDTFIIEPYEQFYLNDVVDWTEKFDNSRDLVLEPMGLLEASEYLYKYKDDKDYYNETYKGEFNESYGQRSGLIDNDFVKQLTTTEVIFSATPIVGQEDVDLVVPTIIKNEDTVKQTESNIRILFYNGLKTTSTIWEIRSTFDWIATAYEYSEYPYAGHFNDPFNATTDINFGLPKRLYYDNTFHDITLTNNNLFNKYHLPFLKQIASRDSKLVAGYFYLKPKDIRNLSFRSVYAFKNAYYRLYKVENYDPNNEITKCLFVKLIDVNPYSVVTGTINGGAADFESGFNGGVQVEEAAPQLKSTQISNNNNADTYTKISGTNNYVNKSADFVEINGDNNQVNSFTRNINIQGNNNIIESGVTDVTLINTNGVTVSESGVTYVDGKKLGNNIVYVNERSDLPDATAGRIILSDGITYIFTTNVDLNGDRLITNGVCNILGLSSETSSITSTGLSAGVPLINSTYTIVIENITIKDVDTAISIDGNSRLVALDWENVNFSNVPTVGVVNTCDNFIYETGAFLNSQGLRFTGTIGTVSFSNSLFSGRASAGNIIELDASCIITRRFRIVYSSVVAVSPTVGINVNASATIPTECYILDTVNFAGGGTYLSGITHTSNMSLFVACKGITNTAVNGQLYMQGNATTTTISNTTDFFKVAGTTTASPDNSKYTATDNRLTNNATVQRKYLVQATITFTSGNNNVCEFAFYDSVTGAVLTASRVKSTANSSGRAENITIIATIQHSSGDYIEVHARNTSTATNITVEDLNLIITEFK